jgi:hypothetical protein
MELDDTNQFLKDNFQNILNGDFDDKFSPEQIKMMIELSFLFNHIKDDVESITFEYNDVRIKVSNIYEIPIEYRQDSISANIRNTSIFKNALSQFLRDKKINDILR